MGCLERPRGVRARRAAHVRPFLQAGRSESGPGPGGLRGIRVAVTVGAGRTSRLVPTWAWLTRDPLSCLRLIIPLQTYAHIIAG
jgi:hypothetical protein